LAIDRDGEGALDPVEDLVRFLMIVWSGYAGTGRNDELEGGGTGCRDAKVQL
jgi:hypothetical protein